MSLINGVPHLQECHDMPGERNCRRDTMTTRDDGHPEDRIDPATDAAPSRHALRVADLSHRRPLDVEITPDTHERAVLARKLDLVELRKLRFDGTIRPLGRNDWALTGHLGATVVQPCVATLEPVTTRIDTEVERRFLADFQEPDDAEVEMPEDDTAEPLGTHIDPAQVMAEALALSLPLYPRSVDAEQVVADVTEPGKTAMTDADAKPFAGLAGLRDQLKRQDE